jgi:hypothetical protein
LAKWLASFRLSMNRVAALRPPQMPKVTIEPLRAA